MKRQLLLIVMILATGTIFAQTKPTPKKDSAAQAAKPSAPKEMNIVAPQGNEFNIAPVPKQYFVVLPADNWQYLFSIVRSSGKLTAVQAEDYIEALNKEIKEVPAPAADTAKKK